jgi:hypothetical protein
VVVLAVLLKRASGVWLSTQGGSDEMAPVHQRIESLVAVGAPRRARGAVDRLTMALRKAVTNSYRPTVLLDSLEVRTTLCWSDTGTG